MGDPGARSAKQRRAQLVYQRCPDCRKSRLGTREGFVEVTPEEVGRYEGCADHVVIDGPTPPGLRRRVVAREAGRCGNPRCPHLADHCHHVVFRSRGGKTELANEVAVCTTCHALIHAGLLRVGGCADGELRWLPVGSSDGAARGDSVGADRLPVLRLVADRLPALGGAGTAGESAIADSSPAPPLNRRDLTQSLMRLGLPATRSRRMIDAAIAAIPTGKATEAAVLRQALRATATWLG